VWFTEVVIFFGIAWFALQVRGLDPRRSTGFDSVTPTALGLGFALGLVNYLAWAAPLMALAERAFPKKVLELFDGSQIFQHQSKPELVVIVLGLGVAAPVCEEFFFRGLLQRALMTRLEPPMAIVVSAVVFSGFHLDPVGLLARFELGVLFGLLAWRSGSVWPGIAAHAANNLTASLLFALGDKTDTQQPPLGLIVGLLVVGNALLALVVKLASGRLSAPRPAEQVVVPPLPALQGVVRWVAVSALGIGLLLALDWRGAALKLYEAADPLPKGVEASLETVRGQARRGEVDLKTWIEARKQASHDAQVKE
jgi:membrane protease YdiL (CAAX protease family)